MPELATGNSGGYRGLHASYGYEHAALRRVATIRSAVRASPSPRRAFEEVDVGENEPVRCLGERRLAAPQRLDCPTHVVPDARLRSTAEDTDSACSVGGRRALGRERAGDAGAHRCFERLEQRRRRRRLRIAARSCRSNRWTCTRTWPAASAWRIRAPGAGAVATRSSCPSARWPSARAQRDPSSPRRSDRRCERLGQSVKKGLLFYGPPGHRQDATPSATSPAHLPGHTTLLITAEQVGLLPEYMTPGPSVPADAWWSSRTPT